MAGTKTGPITSVEQWLDKENWVDVKAEVGVNYEIVDLMKSAKRSILASGGSFSSSYVHPEQAEAFWEVIRDKAKALERNEFGFITIVSSNEIIAGRKQGTAPILELIKEFLHVPQFNVFVANEEIAAPYPHCFIVDGERGFIECKHHEWGDRSYRKFSDFNVAYCAQRLSVAAQLESGRIHPVFPTEKKSMSAALVKDLYLVHADEAAWRVKWGDPKKIDIDRQKKVVDDAFREEWQTTFRPASR